MDVRGPEECWPWLKSTVDGYGRLQYGGRLELAHRVAYELTHGPIPEGKVIDHTCHNRDESCPGGQCPHRLCQNPGHLEPATRQQNTARGRSYFGSQTHCKRDHEYTPENTLIQKGKWRLCRTCIRMKQREWRQRNRRRKES